MIYWNMNPTKNHDEKLMPTLGGMYDTPFNTTGLRATDAVSKMR